MFCLRSNICAARFGMLCHVCAMSASAMEHLIVAGIEDCNSGIHRLPLHVQSALITTLQ